MNKNKIDIIIGGKYKFKNGVVISYDPIWILTFADLKNDIVRLEPNNKLGLPIYYESNIDKFNEIFETYVVKEKQKKCTFPDCSCKLLSTALNVCMV